MAARGTGYVPFGPHRRRYLIGATVLAAFVVAALCSAGYVWVQRGHVVISGATYREIVDPRWLNHYSRQTILNLQASDDRVVYAAARESVLQYSRTTKELVEYPTPLSQTGSVPLQVFAAQDTTSRYALMNDGSVFDLVGRRFVYRHTGDLDRFAAGAVLLGSGGPEGRYAYYGHQAAARESARPYPPFVYDAASGSIRLLGILDTDSAASLLKTLETGASGTRPLKEIIVDRIYPEANENPIDAPLIHPDAERRVSRDAILGSLHLRGTYGETTDVSTFTADYLGLRADRPRDRPYPELGSVAPYLESLLAPACLHDPTYKMEAAEGLLLVATGQGLDVFEDDGSPVSDRSLAATWQIRNPGEGGIADFYRDRGVAVARSPTGTIYVRTEGRQGWQTMIPVSRYKELGSTRFCFYAEPQHRIVFVGADTVGLYDVTSRSWSSTRYAEPVVRARREGDDLYLAYGQNEAGPESILGIAGVSLADASGAASTGRISLAESAMLRFQRPIDDFVLDDHNIIALREGHELESVGIQGRNAGSGASRIIGRNEAAPSIDDVSGVADLIAWDDQIYLQTKEKDILTYDAQTRTLSLAQQGVDEMSAQGKYALFLRKADSSLVVRDVDSGAEQSVRYPEPLSSGPSGSDWSLSLGQGDLTVIHAQGISRYDVVADAERRFRIAESKTRGPLTLEGRPVFFSLSDRFYCMDDAALKIYVYDLPSRSWSGPVATLPQTIPHTDDPVHCDGIKTMATDASGNTYVLFQGTARSDPGTMTWEGPYHSVVARIAGLGSSTAEAPAQSKLLYYGNAFGYAASNLRAVARYQDAYYALADDGRLMSLYPEAGLSVNRDLRAYLPSAGKRTDIRVDTGLLLVTHERPDGGRSVSVYDAAGREPRGGIPDMTSLVGVMAVDAGAGAADIACLRGDSLAIRRCGAGVGSPLQVDLLGTGLPAGSSLTAVSASRSGGADVWLVQATDGYYYYDIPRGTLIRIPLPATRGSVVTSCELVVKTDGSTLRVYTYDGTKAAQAAIALPGPITGTKLWEGSSRTSSLVAVEYREVTARPGTPEHRGGAARRIRLIRDIAAGRTPVVVADLAIIEADAADWKRAALVALGHSFEVPGLQGVFDAVLILGPNRVLAVNRDTHAVEWMSLSGVSDLPPRRFEAPQGMVRSHDETLIYVDSGGFLVMSKDHLRDLPLAVAYPDVRPVIAAETRNTLRALKGTQSLLAAFADLSVLVAGGDAVVSRPARDWARWSAEAHPHAVVYRTGRAPQEDSGVAALRHTQTREPQPNTVYRMTAASGEVVRTYIPGSSRFQEDLPGGPGGTLSSSIAVFQGRLYFRSKAGVFTFELREGVLAREAAGEETFPGAATTNADGTSLTRQEIADLVRDLGKEVFDLRPGPERTVLVRERSATYVGAGVGSIASGGVPGLPARFVNTRAQDSSDSYHIESQLLRTDRASSALVQRPAPGGSICRFWFDAPERTLVVEGTLIVRSDDQGSDDQGSYVKAAAPAGPPLAIPRGLLSASRVRLAGRSYYRLGGPDRTVPVVVGDGVQVGENVDPTYRALGSGLKSMGVSCRKDFGTNAVRFFLHDEPLDPAVTGDGFLLDRFQSITRVNTGAAMRTVAVVQDKRPIVQVFSGESEPLHLEAVLRCPEAAYSVSVDGDRLYAQTRDGRVYALVETSTGSFSFRKRGSENTTPAVFADYGKDRVVLVSFDAGGGLTVRSDFAVDARGAKTGPGGRPVYAVSIGEDAPQLVRMGDGSGASGCFPFDLCEALTAEVPVDGAFSFSQHTGTYAIRYRIPPERGARPEVVSIGIEADARAGRPRSIKAPASVWRRDDRFGPVVEILSASPEALLCRVRREPGRDSRVMISLADGSVREAPRAPEGQLPNTLEAASIHGWALHANRIYFRVGAEGP